MRIRIANQFDAESIAILHAESWRNSYRGIFGEKYLDNNVFQDRLDVWRKRFSSPAVNQVVLVAESDQGIDGFVCAFGNEHERWGTFIDNLHVRKNKKRLGIGKRLMIEVALWSLQHYPGSGMYLNVLEPNISARRFYESLGAIHQDSSPWAPPGGGEVMDLLYVWTDLNTWECI